ncbi:MAG: nucleotide pyrophosphohydrolase [Erysipelotrichaceae bacterium]|nr:nucleotide pyrophosphohydrolase [Erysipelotrichaceae bacterium]
MNINEYQKLAMTTLNPKLNKKEVLINGVMGLCGESGEVIDHVKKHLAQGHELDMEKMIKELGDVAWYLAETAYALDVELEEVFVKNIEKLKKRYPEGFDENRSIQRKNDENPSEI